MKYETEFSRYLDQHIAIASLSKTISEDVEFVAEKILNCFQEHKTLFFCGNGGSAADSQHLAAEFMGRFLSDRNPIPSIALTVDTSAITAIGNDYGYDEVFSRQLQGIGKEGDILVGISTSGNSKNVVKAINKANEIGITSIGLTGNNPGEVGKESRYSISVPSEKTNTIQEMHISIGHFICGYVEKKLFFEKPWK